MSVVVQPLLPREKLIIGCEIELQLSDEIRLRPRDAGHIHQVARASTAFGLENRIRYNLGKHSGRRIVQLRARKRLLRGGILAADY